MPLGISLGRFAAIGKAVHQRRTEALAAEIDATTVWHDQPHFSDVDDFLNFVDSQVEPSKTPRTRSSKRP
jgi:hypothetical protein